MSRQPDVRAYLPQPVMTVPDQVHPSLKSEQHHPDILELITDALPDTTKPIPAMFQVQGSPTPDPPTTLSAPSPVQSLRPQRHRTPNVRLNPAEWELGKMDTAQQFIPTMDWCLDMIRWNAKREVFGG